MVIGKVKTARQGVGHLVRLATDVGDFVVVAMMAAVQAGEMADVGGGLIQGDRAFFVAGDGSDVVVEGSECAVMQVEHSVRDMGLGEHSSLFQVTVRDVPSWVVGGDDARLDVGGKRRAPE